MVFDVLIPTAIVGGVGLLAGLGLSVASKKFEVKVDERVGLVREVLPEPIVVPADRRVATHLQRPLLRENANQTAALWVDRRLPIKLARFSA